MLFYPKGHPFPSHIPPARRVHGYISLVVCLGPSDGPAPFWSMLYWLPQLQQNRCQHCSRGIAMTLNVLGPCDCQLGIGGQNRPSIHGMKHSKRRASQCGCRKFEHKDFRNNGKARRRHGLLVSWSHQGILTPQTPRPALTPSQSPYSPLLMWGTKPRLPTS